MRILSALLLLLAASVAGPVLARSAANGEAAPAGRVKSGTGFSVSRDGFLVTSAHVVAGCQNVSVMEPDGTARPGYVIASDRRLDLALLWTDGAGARSSAVAAGESPRAGEKVFTLGFGVIATKPLWPVLIEGSLVGDSTAQPGNRILVIRAMLHAGSSGGAVLAGDGSLLGMVIGRDQEHPELGLALPSGDIEGLLLAYGITLPKRDSVANPADFLSAISVLIQCSTSSN